MLFIKSRNTSSFSDEDLVIKYKASEDVFYVGELFKRYTHLAFGVCMKYLKDEEESKDAVMQVFEKLLTDLKKHEVENFKSWLYSVCKNFCLMKLRKHQFQIPLDSIAENSASFMEFDTNLHLLDDKEVKLLQLEDAVACLDKEQRVCVELFYLKEKSYVEITQETGYTLNEVKSYLQNARRNLKIYMTKNEERE